MRAARSGFLALATVASALAASCGNDAVVDQSIGDMATEVCDLAFRCCERGELDYYIGPFVVDQDNCVDRLRQNADVDPAVLFVIPFDGLTLALPNIAVVERAVAEERAAIDGEALAACLDYLRGLECNIFAVPEEVGCEPPEPVVETPCDASLIVIGQVGAGGACSSPSFSLECQDGLVCRAISALGVGGACVEPGLEGEFCFDDAECHEDLYCSLLDGTCQVPQPLGAACLYANPDDPAPLASTLLIECDPLLTCDPVTDTCVDACSRGAACSDDLDCDLEAGLVCIVGRCDEPRAAGLPCAGNDDCDLGLRCAPELGTGAMICQTPLANGEDCSTGRPQDCESGFCDPSTFTCAAASAPDELCPSGSHTQCDGGYCRTTYTYCNTDATCAALSGTCNLTAQRCEYYCIERLPDGSICSFDHECVSDDCVNGFCRTIPLANGQPCDSSSQCASQFCSTFEAEPICEELPLANGRACSSNSQCDSGVCFSGSCQAGLSEGADCSSFADPPCAIDLYCDYEQSPALCTPKRDAGAACDSNVQCRGSCTTRFGRRLCDATPGEEAAVCDGQ